MWSRFTINNFYAVLHLLTCFTFFNLIWNKFLRVYFQSHQKHSHLNITSRLIRSWKFNELKERHITTHNMHYVITIWDRIKIAQSRCNLLCQLSNSTASPIMFNELFIYLHNPHTSTINCIIYGFINFLRHKYCTKHTNPSTLWCQHTDAAFHAPARVANNLMIVILSLNCWAGPTRL